MTDRTEKTGERKKRAQPRGKAQRRYMVIGDAAIIAKMRFEHPDWGVKQIAEETGLSMSQVEHRLKFIERTHLESIVQDANKYKARALADLRYIRGEALRAWRESGGERETKRDQEWGPKNGPDEKRKTAVTIERTRNDPDARFLNIYLECMQREAVLYGIGAKEQPQVGLATLQISREMTLKIAAQYDLRPTMDAIRKSGDSEFLEEALKHCITKPARAAIVEDVIDAEPEEVERG